MQWPVVDDQYYLKSSSHLVTENAKANKKSDSDLGHGTNFPTSLSLQRFSIPLAAVAPAGPGDDDDDGGGGGGGGVPTARFTFSLSSTEDAASKQGSFECLQADRPG